MPTPRLPDAEALLAALYRAQLPGDVTVTELIPDDLMRVLPLVRVHRWGGAASHPLFLDRALLQVDCYAVTRQTAYDLAQECRGGLYLGWAAQTRTPFGAVGSYRESQAPVEVRTADQPSGLFQFQGQYELHLGS